MNLMITTDEALRLFEKQGKVEPFAGEIAAAFVERAGNPARFTPELMLCMFACVFEAGRIQGKRECRA